MTKHPSWRLDVLRDHIRSQGSEHLYLLEVVNSVSRIGEIFDFHMRNARDGLKGFMSDAQDATNLARLFNRLNGDAETENAILAVEAHLIGAMHSARSVFDIYSHLINGLVLNSMFRIDRCDIHKVEQALPASPLKLELSELIGSYGFKYLAGFINTTKHRALVKSNFTADFVDDLAGIRILGFEYDGDVYPRAWGFDVLKQTLDVKNQHVRCGRALNEALGLQT